MVEDTDAAADMCSEAYEQHTLFIDIVNEHATMDSFLASEAFLAEWQSRYGALMTVGWVIHIQLQNVDYMLELEEVEEVSCSEFVCFANADRQRACHRANARGFVFAADKGQDRSLCVCTVIAADHGRLHTHGWLPRT